MAVLPPGDYGGENPRQAWLIIEVAKSSLEDDREKAGLYASSEVEEYWIVNLVDGVLEVYRDAANGGYQSVQKYLRSAVVRLAHFPDVEVLVDELFPRP